MNKGAKRIIKSSVLDSVKKLISEAGTAYKEGKRERSKRYIQMAMDLVKKHKVKVPEELANSFCRKCHAVWLPGDTVTVSFDKRHGCLRVTCACGYAKRL